MKIDNLKLTLLLSCFAINSFAANTDGTVNVSASLGSSCNLTNASLEFGLLDLDLDTSAYAAMTLTCTGALPISASASTGQNSDNAPSGYDYAMTNGSEYLGYNLFQSNGSGAANWADSTMSTFSFVGNVAQIPFYGVIDTNQTMVTSGFYTDVVAVTVTY